RRLGRCVQAILRPQQEGGLSGLLCPRSLWRPCDLADLLDRDPLGFTLAIAESSGEALVGTAGKMVEQQIHFGELAREDEILDSVPPILLDGIGALDHGRVPMPEATCVAITTSGKCTCNLH